MNNTQKLLAEFTEYCNANPELRFWQALRNWSGFPFIYVSDFLVTEEDAPVVDTFYFEEKDR